MALLDSTHLKMPGLKNPAWGILNQVSLKSVFFMLNGFDYSLKIGNEMKNAIWLGVAALLFAAQVQAGEVSVSDAWSRATAPGQEVGMVGLVVTSQKDARLIAVSSPASSTAEIHTMTMDNGVMKMRQIEALPLSAKKPATLGPGGNHLMLIGLKQALKPGDTVELTLTVQFADNSTEKVNVKAQVRPLTAMQHKLQR
ncbi:MAG TPA: copper chaperone PCu(A)C [Gallionellaceae bacterium]|nr:copper chaperone PCu(A)C [Gallionellaceae bacterium]